MSNNDIVLKTTSQNGYAVTVEVAAPDGGRVRQITIDDGQTSIAVFAAHEHTPAHSKGWGSFPMAPWAGRIRHGRFNHLHADVRLDLNHIDGPSDNGGLIHPADPAPATIEANDRRHAIHGTTFTRRWDVVSSTDISVEMTCPLEGALGWPFAGTARQILTLHPDHIGFELSVEAEGNTTFPASVGWHPWFVKPDRLDFSPTAMYVRDDIGLPTGELIEPPPGRWDDCFINERPVVMHYDRLVAPAITVASEDCDHWVVYDMPDATTCIEPQSGPPDAPTTRPEVVASGRPLRHTMTIGW
ncbi:MAG: aldose 1-epimerase [Ilumatobacter sp.]|jgi:aldose 1-epimerase